MLSVPRHPRHSHQRTPRASTRRVLVRPALALALLSSSPVRPSRVGAQADPHYQTDFPPEEFKARWANIYDQIGDNGVAIVQGIGLTPGFIFPRQHNEFYYLSGVETPGAYIMLDGRRARRRSICRAATRDSRRPRGACCPPTMRI